MRPCGGEMSAHMHVHVCVLSCVLSGLACVACVRAIVRACHRARFCVVVRASYHACYHAVVRACYIVCGCYDMRLSLVRAIARASVLFCVMCMCPLSLSRSHGKSFHSTRHCAHRLYVSVAKIFAVIDHRKRHGSLWIARLFIF